MNRRESTPRSTGTTSSNGGKRPRRLGWIAAAALVLVVLLPLTAFAGIGAWRGVEKVFLGTAVETAPFPAATEEESAVEEEWRSEDDRGDRPGFLGVSTTGLTNQLRTTFGVPAGEGVLVSEVNEDSAAYRAGLTAGDVITRVDGRTVEDSGDLRRAIRRAGADQTVSLEIYRDGQSLMLDATLGAAARTRTVRWHGDWHSDEDWDEERAEAFAERMEEFGERMAEWGEEFGERFDEEWAEEFERKGEEFGRAMEAWGEEFGRRMEERFGDHGEWHYDQEWDEEHLQEMLEHVESTLQNLDFSHIGEMVEAALAGVDFEAIEGDVSRAVEDALRAVDNHQRRE